MRKYIIAGAMALMSTAASAESVTGSHVVTTTTINAPTVSGGMLWARDTLSQMLADFDAEAECHYYVEIEQGEFAGEYDACELSETIQYILDNYNYDWEEYEDEHYEDVLNIHDDLMNLVQLGHAADEHSQNGIETDEFRDYVEAKDDFIDAYYDELGDPQIHDDFHAEAIDLTQYYFALRGRLDLNSQAIAGAQLILYGIEALRKVE